VSATDLSLFAASAPTLLTMLGFEVYRHSLLKAAGEHHAHHGGTDQRGFNRRLECLATYRRIR
jgi:hypothetical protein